MKKLILLFFAPLILSSSLASAALYKVNFSGSFDPDIEFQGYFVFDDAGLDTEGDNLNGSTGFENKLELSITTPTDTYHVTEYNSVIRHIGYSDGNLISWALVGYFSPSIFYDFQRYADSELDDIDFGIFTDYGIILYNDAYINNTNYSIDWTVERYLTPVPIPAALPLYGAGVALLGFLGWRRRRVSVR